MDEAIRADSERSHSWDAFVEMLQQNLLPKGQREVKPCLPLKNLKQRADQTVAELFSHMKPI